MFNDPTLKTSEINVETLKGIVVLSSFVASPADIPRAAEVALGVSPKLVHVSQESRRGPFRAVDIGMFAQLCETTGQNAREVAFVDLSEMLRDVAAAAEDEGAPREVRVQLTGAETCVVHGNAFQLRSALENVVQNAVFYAGDNTTVDVEVSEEKAAVVVYVRDRGPGVPEDALRAIFLPFFRVAEACERDSGGAGMGLAIAAAAITGHGGLIDACNNPDGGLFVTIRLPYMCRKSNRSEAGS